jgi:hypothetical protein
MVTGQLTEHTVCTWGTALPTVESFAVLDVLVVMRAGVLVRTERTDRHTVLRQPLALGPMGEAVLGGEELPAIRQIPAPATLLKAVR